jgi:hypothetical protein
LIGTLICAPIVVKPQYLYLEESFGPNSLFPSALCIFDNGILLGYGFMIAATKMMAKSQNSAPTHCHIVIVQGVVFLLVTCLEKLGA